MYTSLVLTRVPRSHTSILLLLLLLLFFLLLVYLCRKKRMRLFLFLSNAFSLSIVRVSTYVQMQTYINMYNRCFASITSPLCQLLVSLSLSLSARRLLGYFFFSSPSSFFLFCRSTIAPSIYLCAFLHLINSRCCPSNSSSSFYV